MELEKLKDKVKEFEQRAEFEGTEFSKLIKMFEEEFNTLRTNEENKEIVNHQLTDLLVLIMQIANRYDTDFDKELKIWFEKSKRYLKSP